MDLQELIVMVGENSIFMEFFNIIGKGVRLVKSFGWVGTNVAFVIGKRFPTRTEPRQGIGPTPVIIIGPAHRNGISRSTPDQEQNG